MAAIGLKLGQAIDLKSLRYGRILIYTDADCLHGDTLIQTKDGHKRISEITHEDEVLTHTGVYKKVKNIVSKDISKFVKIRVNGNEIICSEDHRMMVFRDGEVIETKVKEIKHSDFLLLKKK
jgi:intein/homing endonuclease